MSDKTHTHTQVQNAGNAQNAFKAKKAYRTFKDLEKFQVCKKSTPNATKCKSTPNATKNWPHPSGTAPPGLHISRFSSSNYISQTLHVWHIYLHWGGWGGQCRHIWHTWSVWVFIFQYMLCVVHMKPLPPVLGRSQPRRTLAHPPHHW